VRSAPELLRQQEFGVFTGRQREWARRKDDYFPPLEPNIRRRGRVHRHWII
jgi:hypothetical protein